MLMKGMPINVGVILMQNMMKFRYNLRLGFCYGGQITYIQRVENTEEEAADLNVSLNP